MRVRFGLACVALVLLTTGCGRSSTVGFYPATPPANAASFDGAYRTINVAYPPSVVHNALLVAMNMLGAKIDVTTPTMASGALMERSLTAAGYVEQLPSGGSRITLIAKHSGVVGSFWSKPEADGLVGELQSEITAQLAAHRANGTRSVQ